MLTQSSSVSPSTLYSWLLPKHPSLSAPTMAIPTGAAAYKKKDGILTLTPDQKTVIWTPGSAATGPRTLSLSISNITSECLAALPSEPAN